MTRAGLWLSALLAASGAALSSVPAGADLIGSAPTAAALVSYFNWADHASPGFSNDNVHLLNPGTQASTGTVSIPGIWSASFSVAARGESLVSVPPGVIGGPVRVAVSSGLPVIASQRITYNQTLTEVPALRPEDASAEGWFAWYDLASPGMKIDNLHVLNPGGSAASGSISVGVPGTAPLAFTVAPGAEAHVNFPPGVIGGPVHYQVTSGPPVLVSQRVHYMQGFNEVVAMRSSDAAPDTWFPWYDQASPGMLVDNIHVLNPGPAPSTGTISLPGSATRTFSLEPGQQTWAGWPGGIGGPAHVSVTSGNPVLTSQRLSKPPGFQEWYGEPSSKASTESWFNWYDNASPAFVDDVHVTNVGSGSANVSLLLPGSPTATLVVPPGVDRVYTYPAGTIGGPLRIISDLPVLSTQRAFIVDTRVIPVPWRGMAHSLSCEAAALQMLMAYYGKPYNQDDIMAVIGQDRRPPYWDDAGMHWGDPYTTFVGSVDGSEYNYTGFGAKYPPVAAAAQHFGVQPLVATEGLPAQQLYGFVLSGRPAIVWGSASYTPQPGVWYTAFDGRRIFWGRLFEHVLVVAAVTPDSVGLLDSRRSPGLIFIPKAQFEAQWAQFNNAAIVFP